MAEILSHPHVDRRNDEFLYRTKSGTVRISAPDGEPVLTVERALFLLETTKIVLMEGATCGDSS